MLVRSAFSTIQQSVTAFAINVLVVTNEVNSKLNKAVLYAATLLSSILVPYNYTVAFRLSTGMTTKSMPQAFTDISTAVPLDPNDDYSTHLTPPPRQLLYPCRWAMLCLSTKQ